MNKFRILTLIMMTTIAMTASAVNNKEKTIKLKIIETSDVHGYFFPYDFIERRPISGTLSRVNTYVEEQRKKYGEHLLLIDNGDILQGQPTCYWSNFVMSTKENIAASIINYMRYDAETVGNHDIETGHPVYDKWIREVRCPLLGANIVDKASKSPYVSPYATIVRDGVKIVILGMITPTISCWLTEDIYEGLDFQEMVSCAKHWIKIIKEKEQPDLIFGLFHSGLNGAIVMPNGLEENATEKVARNVPGFDAIFFGHDHQMHKEWIENIEGQKVLCLDPSCYANYVAEASIELTLQNGIVKKKKIDGKLVDVRKKDIDQKMVNHFKKDIDDIKQYVEKRVGEFKNTVYTRDSYFGNSAFTDFIQNLQLLITGADISFNAPLSFDSSIKAGSVTVADMFKLYRFENRLYVLKMTGKEIRNHLEMSYNMWVNTMISPDDHLLLLNDESTEDQQRMGFRNYTFNFDSAAGIDYEVDVRQPNGKKVRIISLSDGSPFDEDKWYTVAMNSYRACGGGELLTHGAQIPKDSLSSRVVYKSELDLRHYLMKEIERLGVVDPQPNHNWKFVPEEWTKPAGERDKQILFRK